MTDWSYDEASHRYRNAETGRYVSAASERAIHADYQQRQGERIATLAGRVARGDVSVAEWEKAMQKEIKQAQGVAFAFGKGGVKQVTEDEARILGAVTEAQNAYLRGFAEDLAAGRLTEAQIAARAALYGQAANIAYWQGKGASYEGLDLPAMPGVGTICLVNCRCEWTIVESDTEWSCTWTIGATENCATCVDRAAVYAPYVQPKTVEVAA